MESQVRINVESRMPFADGQEFDGVGAYEALVGTVDFAIDPADLSNETVTDLKLAPRNDDGLVEYSTDLYILKPLDLSTGNGRLLYDVNNRGNLRAMQFFNDGVHANRPAKSKHAGNGFLMRRGYTLVCSGWQGDILPGEDRFTMRLPVAVDQGREVTGDVRTEFILDRLGVRSQPLAANDYSRSYEAVSPDTSLATFTMKKHPHDAPEPIPPDRWRFAREDADGNVTESTTDCYLPEGFEPGWIYELVYEAKNPTVMGLGFTGLRDLISFLIHAESDDGGVANPLRTNGVGIEKAYGWGRSQSGRYLREFVYRGFNADSQGRRVFDAISPHVSGGGRVVLNYRFAQPGRFPRLHSDHAYPSDQFPFAYAETTDHLTGKTDGILKRPDTDPLVLHTQTSSEYWDRRGSLVHTDTRGSDLGEQDGVRVFLFAGSQHNADPLAGPSEGALKHPTNPLNTTPLLRALLDNLDAWATEGTAPPASRVPMSSEETAVVAETVKTQFPSIPGVQHPEDSNHLSVQDHGPDSENGILREPAEEDLSRQYNILVPQIDADGNEIPGIRTPHMDVPLATHTGWNFRLEDSHRATLAGTVGSYMAFARTKAEREAIGDSRPSIQERYGSRTRYVRAIALAAQRLVDQRLLLEEDADRYVELAIDEPAFDE